MICNLIILYVFFSYLGQLNNICDLVVDVEEKKMELI